MVSRNDKIIEMATKIGIIRPRDVENLGIPREYLYRLWRRGELVRIGRGLYMLRDFPSSELASFTEVAILTPNAVVCLLSALHFHNLTTQIPHKVWIAVKKNSWEPNFKYPPIELVRLSGKTYSFGIEEHTVNKIQIKVYNPAKTVADCFKFRNKIGLDVAIEALRETMLNRIATSDQIWEAAKICRVSNVIRPYMESII